MSGVTLFMRRNLRALEFASRAYFERWARRVAATAPAPNPSPDGSI